MWLDGLRMVLVHIKVVNFFVQVKPPKSIHWDLNVVSHVLHIYTIAS